MASSSSVTIKTEYRFLRLPNEIYKHFYVEFRNDRKTDKRKCIKCDTIVTSCNGGTSGMRNHLSVCKGPSRRNENSQPKLDVSSFSGNPVIDPLREITALAYDDHISMRTVANSKTLNKLYKKAGIRNVNYATVTASLEAEYQALFHNVKAFISKRPITDILCLSFDKWTSADGKKISRSLFVC